MPLVLAAVSDAVATSYTWMGVEDSVWNNPDNWSPNGIPGSGDSIVVPAGTNPSGNDQNRTLVSATIAGNLTGVSHLSVQNLVVSGNLATTTTSVQTLILDGGAISGAVTLGASATLNGGALQSGFESPSGTTVVVASGSTSLGSLAEWKNGGTVTMSGGSVEGYDRSVITNTGTWLLPDASTPFTNYFGGNVFLNQGLLHKPSGSGETEVSGNWQFLLDGDTRCSQGTLRFSALNTRLSTGTQLTGAGTVAFAGATELAGQASETAGSVLLDGGTLTCAVGSSITGSLEWRRGGITGTLLVPAGSTLIVTGEDTKYLNSQAELTVNGLLRWDGPGTVTGYYDTTVTVASGGTLEFTADGTPFQNYFGENSLVLQGTMLKSGGSGGSTLLHEWTYLVSGTVTCSVPGLDFAGITVFEGTPSVGGPGAVTLRNQIQLGTAALTFTAPATWTGGNWTGSGGTLSGSLDWTGGTSNGSWSIAANGTLRVLDGAEKWMNTQATLGCAGRLELVSGSLIGYDGSTISVATGGVVHIAGCSLDNYFGGNLLEIQNGALLTTETSTNVTVSWALNNNGTATVSGGTLSLNGGGTSGGLYQGNAGILIFGGGTHTLVDGCRIEGPGTIQVPSGGVLLATGTVPARIHLNGGAAGSASESGEFRLTHGSQWSGGSLTGRVRVVEGATLTTFGPGYPMGFLNSGARLDVDGKLLWQGPGAIMAYDSNTVVISPTGVLECAADGEVFSRFYAGSQVTNQGVIRKTGGSGESVFRDADYTHAGRLETEVGKVVFQATLNLVNGCQMSGEGRVVLRENTFLTGATHLDNTTLELAAGNLHSAPEANGSIQGGSIEWIAGSVGGKVTWNSNARTIGSADKQINAFSELANAGTLTLGGTRYIWLIEGTILRNLPGGTLVATAQAPLAEYWSGTQLINEGLMKLGDNSTDHIRPEFVDFVQTSTGRLEVGVAGNLSPLHDRLEVYMGAASLGGTLIALTENGYAPAQASIHEVLTASSLAGTFTKIQARWFDPSYPGDNRVLLVGRAQEALDFDTWAADHALTGSDALPNADPDQDSVPNLVEYAFNTDPAAANGSGITPSSVETFGADRSLVLRYRRWTGRMDRGLSYEPQGCSDLASWQTSGLVDEPDPDAPLIPGSEARRCRVPLASGAKFLRVSVSAD